MLSDCNPHEHNRHLKDVTPENFSTGANVLITTNGVYDDSNALPVYVTVIAHALLRGGGHIHAIANDPTDNINIKWDIHPDGHIESETTEQPPRDVLVLADTDAQHLDEALSILTATAEQKHSTTSCISHAAGHQPHWIPVLNLYSDTPRTTAAIAINPDDPHWFTATHPATGELMGTYWTHDSDRLARVVGECNGTLLHVNGTLFFTGKRAGKPGDSTPWFYVAYEPSHCVPSDPAA